MQKYDETEIDLIDLLKKSLRQWKLMLVIILVCLIAVPGVQYFRQYGSYQAALKAASSDAESQEDDADEEVASALDALSDYEKYNIESVKSLYEDLMPQIEADEEYLESSVCASLDYDAIPTVTMTFSVSGSKDNTGSVKLYLGYINAGAWTEGASQIFGIGSQYAAELVSARAAEGINAGQTIVISEDQDDIAQASFMVVVYGSDSDQAAAIADAVSGALLSYADTVKASMGAHTLTMISSTESVTVDTDLRSTINAIKSDIKNNKDVINTKVAAFSDNQKTVWLAWLNEVNGTDSEQPTITAKEEEAEITAPSISKKYVAIGLLLGIVLALGCSACIYIFGGKVHTEDELSMITGQSVIYAFSGAKGKEAGEQTLLESRLGVLLKKEDVKDAVFVTTGKYSDPERAVLEQVADKLESTVGVHISFAEDFLGDASSVDSVGNSSSVIITERLESSKRSAVSTQMTVLKTLGANCLGVVVFE